MKQNLAKQRLHLTILGAVQGVGFRPFVYKLAKELGLVGWVNNSAQGVSSEIEGERSQLETFLLRLEREKPPRSFIQSLEYSWLNPIGYNNFEIKASVRGEKTALVVPDIATCPECLQEVFNPSNRRYRYPFTNCTNCGPRFSIIEGLPYDRSQTTMKKFMMCDRCQSEYENPLNRRFHAQPNACPDCGPHLELWNSDGKILALHHEALLGAAEAIFRGKIIAIKGLGGFHLVVNACNERAVQRLREGKHREEKPFALMYPSLESIKAHCHVSALEERLLLSPEAPIVLLRQKEELTDFYRAVAPGNPYLGIMLPYTPLHHLLMKELGFPTVATSGNLTDEPICTDEYEALQRLGNIAELFLVHDRPIARPVDDSVVRVMAGREIVLRRARGYAPLPVTLKIQDKKSPILAVGAHLKNNIALLIGRQVFISQHIGDLETVPAFDSFKRAIADFEELYELHPVAIACDAHLHYLSTQYAWQSDLPAFQVQHHYAHVLSCMVENELMGSDLCTPVLGIAWDGTGYGLDGTIWGGEFLAIEDIFFKRIAHLRTFRLPGGEKAVKEPRRVAIGLLYELLGDKLFERKELTPIQAFTVRELTILKTMLQKNVNAPITSSAGRLFDAVASIVGLRQENRYEGQAAMELEFALSGLPTEERYKFELIEPLATDTLSPAIVDWAIMVRDILTDIYLGLPIGQISAKFHNTLVEMMIAVAKYARKKHIVLTGGCFQNKYLTERAIQRLRAEKFLPYWHQRIPPNDGGIALGQIVGILRNM
ncbi:carbamoyltransferase HypF [Pleurocapsales cyanobacterium LEGE 06147]|nr:carbamoyltransferase HypF [Pleurocapsales cyanobacterium LEGE 06147]